MGWFTRFLFSSIGRKVVMSLTGLFLITFLVIHLLGNLQLVLGDEGRAFNEYAYFMTHNPGIKTVSYGLYFFILLHIYMGTRLWLQNRAARGPQGYAMKRTRSAGNNATTAKNMMWLGSIIAIFIFLHMYQFWLQMKLGNLEVVAYDEGNRVNDLYQVVAAAFSNPIYVWLYVFSMIIIGWHLWHGFQSAFQTLGLQHRKYTPLIKAAGKLYAIVIPALFAFIPLYMYYVILN